MMTKGWIRLHRSMLEWEWYDEVNTKSVFLHLLLTASIQEVEWHGILIPRGGRIVSLRTLVRELNLSMQKIRTALQHLEKTGEITKTSHGNYTVIKLNQFDHYQQDCYDPTEQQHRTNNAPTKNQHHNNNNNNNKNNNNDKKERETRARIPSIDEVRAFCLDRQSKINPEKFFSFYEASGWQRGGQPIHDWKALVRVWEVREDEFERNAKPRSDEEQMSQAEIDEMNDYLSLVNRCLH